MHPLKGAPTTWRFPKHKHEIPQGEKTHPHYIVDSADSHTNGGSTTGNGAISESDISERKIGREIFYGLMWRKNTGCVIPGLHFSPPNPEGGRVIIHTRRITGELREMGVLYEPKSDYSTNISCERRLRLDWYLNRLRILPP